MMLPLVVFLFAMRPDAALAPMNLPKKTQQVVLVETESWTSTAGELRMLSKSARGWVAVGDRIPVSVGRAGLAWGRGLQLEVGEGPQKTEGDGKAPAGVFRLGTAFGYAQEAPSGSKWPYRQATNKDFYVDDPDSPEYNQWVTLGDDVSQPHAPWKSAEGMKRSDHLYEWGIVIEQNKAPVVKGRGSAVFFHIWKQPGFPTAGCTAMPRENLLILLRWLDPQKDPLVIQVPHKEIGKVKISGSSP